MDMICIYCSSKTKIVNSRSFKRGFEKWRRHCCLSCKEVFTSRELADLETSLLVIKNSGSLEPFYMSKLLISIYKALDHRKNAQNDAYVLMQTICAQVLPVVKKQTSTKTVAEQTIIALKHFDPVGAVKYQSAQTPIMNKRDIRRTIR